MSIVKELKNGKLHLEADSVRDVFRIIDKMGWTPKNDKASDSSGYGGFNVFGSLAEARDIFENHPERIREFSEKDDRLEVIESPGKDVEFDITGDYVDIDKYLEGIPEVFGSAVMGNPNGLFCTINILGSFVSYTRTGYQITKQKRVLRLVDWLEAQGVRVQIVVSEDSSVSYSQVVVKQFHDPLDLNQLAIALHPEWLRRIMFLVFEQSKTWTYGYGSSIKYDNTMKNRIAEPEEGLYVYVGGYIPFDDQDEPEQGELNAAFDKIEGQLFEAITDGRQFTDEPMVVKGGR